MGKGLTFKGSLGSEGILKELLGCGVRENRGSSRETDLRALSDTPPPPSLGGVPEQRTLRREKRLAGRHSADLSPMALPVKSQGRAGVGPQHRA